ncbi:Ankyrin repeat domain-containing protein [Balamuthia mandrillaris]
MQTEETKKRQLEAPEQTPEQDENDQCKDNEDLHHHTSQKKLKTSPTDPCCWIEELLPDELLYHVLSLLPPGLIAVAARTCRSPRKYRHLLPGRSVCSSVSLLRWAFDNAFPEPFEPEGSLTMPNAVKLGGLPVVQWLCEQPGYSLRSLRNCEAAAETGQLALLQWLRDHGANWAGGVLRLAALNGHLEVLQWAAKNYCPWKEDPMADDYFYHPCPVLLAAAHGGHVEVLEWLWEHYPTRMQAKKHNSSYASTAASRGHVQVLEWLKERGFRWDEFTFWGAAVHARWEVLKWLQENGCPWDERAFSAVIERRGMETMEWLHERGCPCEARAFEAAARNGWLEGLQWADGRGLLRSVTKEEIAKIALEAGHVDVFEWAVERGSLDNVDEIGVGALKVGSWKLFKWAVDNGMAFDEHSMLCIASEGLQKKVRAFAKRQKKDKKEKEEEKK